MNYSGSSKVYMYSTKLQIDTDKKDMVFKESETRKTVIS